MNSKKIANEIRNIAKSYKPQSPIVVNTTYESLTAIANEIDPPPEKKYTLTYEHSCGHYVATSVNADQLEKIKEILRTKGDKNE